MNDEHKPTIFELWDARAPTPAPPPPTIERPRLDLGGTATSYAAAALRSECEKVAATPEGSRNPTLNEAAFRMGRHVGAGNIDAAVVRVALRDAGLATGLPAHEVDTVLRDNENGAITQGATHPRHPAPREPLPELTILETPEPDDVEVKSFWDARPILRHLHDYARARRVSPWAVLGVALARICTATPYTVTLPPIVGGRGSLNLFVGIVGVSGSGKGAADAVGEEAIRLGYIETLTPGSGEGIAHGYKRRTKGGVEWVDERHAVLFSVPEIDTLAALGDRRGTTLFPELRRGWTGERLGFQYADPAKRLPVEAHQYRLCLVAGIQPARAAVLLDDADGGTPQRFIWLPAGDPDAPDDPPPCPDPIEWRPPRRERGTLANLSGTHDIEVCPLASRTIIGARLAGLRGERDALDSHALLAQLKAAAVLGLADGRYSVTDDDWHLADVIARKSAATRAAVTSALRGKATETQHARAEAEAGRAVLVAERVEDAAVKRVCGSVVRRLRMVGDWTPRGELRQSLGRDRGHVDEALTRLLEAGQIEREEFARAVKYRLIDRGAQ